MKDLNMILKAGVVISVALCVLGDRRPAISEQRVKQQFSGHHGDLSHVGHHNPEHHEEYAWSYPSYEFSYKVVDPHTYDIKEQYENRHKDEVNGFYWLIQPDGHKRYVKYHADDKHGFSADVLYSKPIDEDSKELKDKEEKERKEHEKREKERKEHEKKEKEREEHEKKEKERKEHEKKEKARKEHEQKEKERIEHEKKEKARKEHEQREKAKREHEKKEKARKEQEEQEQQANHGGIRGYKRRYFVGHYNQDHEENNKNFDKVYIDFHQGINREDYNEEKPGEREEKPKSNSGTDEEGGHNVRHDDQDQNNKPKNNNQGESERKDEKQDSRSKPDEKDDLWLGLQGWYRHKSDEIQKVKGPVKDEIKKENHGLKKVDQKVKEPEKEIHKDKQPEKGEHKEEKHHNKNDIKPERYGEKDKDRKEKYESKAGHSKEDKHSEKDDPDKRAGGIWGGLQIWGDHSNEGKNEDENKTVHNGRHSWGWSQNGRDDRKIGNKHEHAKHDRGSKHNEAKKEDQNEGLGSWGDRKPSHRRARPSYHIPYEFGERLH